MIRVVKQLCINSPSKIEGDKGPPRRRQAFHVPRSTSPAPQALLITYLPYALRYSVGVRLVYCLKIFEK